MSSSTSSQLTRSHLPSPRFADALRGITNALGIGDLIQRRRAFGAVAAAAAGMFGIAFEAADAHRILVDESEQAASGFAVEANRRNNLAMFLDFARPRCGIVFDPVVPLFHGRIAVLTALSASSRKAHRIKGLPGLSHFSNPSLTQRHEDLAGSGSKARSYIHRPNSLAA